MIDANRKLFPWKCVQGSKVPKKWLSLCGQLILTIDNHIKRNMWSLVNWCCMCKDDVEFVDLLPNCLWFLVNFLAFGVHWVLSYKAIDVLFCWKGLCMGGIVIVMFAVWLLIVLCEYFGGNEIAELRASFLCFLLECPQYIFWGKWMVSYNSLVDFMDHLSLWF